MAIDPRHLGHTLPVFTVEVTPERVRRFAEAIGEITLDPEIAPPTFLKTIEGEHNSSRAILDTLGVDVKLVLHAEQEFDYLAPVRTGQRLTVERRVSDLYDKRGGAMEFIVIESVFRSQAGVTVARSRQVVLVRHPKTEEVQ